MRSHLAADQFELSEAHQELAQLPWNLVYTTNYDDLLQRALGQNAPIEHDNEYERLGSSASKQTRLIHLHGTLRNFRTLTGRDFSNWEQRNQVPFTFLKNVFLQKTFLFVGYSFSDPHLSRGLIPWLQDIRAGRNLRNYAWMWQVSDDQRRLLDSRDKIEALSINNDADWAACFRQLRQAYDQIMASKNSTTGKPGKKGSVSLPSTATIQINSYKLFYFRTKRRIDHTRLGEITGIETKEIKRLEKLVAGPKGGKGQFPTASREALIALEKALRCPAELQTGRDDDLLAVYVMFYMANRGAVGKRSTQQSLHLRSSLNDTRAIVFDFGGTLTLSGGQKSTWERIWASVGYGINDAGELHEAFVQERITHQEWCDLTCEKLAAKGFSRDHLQGIIDQVQVIHGIEETFERLRSRGIPIYIASGSIRDIIISALGPAVKYVHEVKSNEMVFDDAGMLTAIWGSAYDFQGKADFIHRVAHERRCDPVNILFVGNNLNDHWASKSGARTLCVNAGETDYTNTLIWTYHLKEMTNLAQVLKFVWPSPA